MKKEKKKWETPKLICLYRGRPEEAVLQVCKDIGLTPFGPQTSCKYDAGGGFCSTKSKT